MRIARLRKEQGLTQSELAQRCETTQQQIARIEGGIVDPRLSTLRRIAEALDCELIGLFYTRAEFLAEVREVAQAEAGEPGQLSLALLNTLCARRRNIPTFHPFWEELVLSGRKVKFTSSIQELK